MAKSVASVSESIGVAAGGETFESQLRDRPPTPPEQAEAEQLHRIVELAHQILIALRKDRGSYASERELRMLLTDNGIAFSNDGVTLAPWIYWSRWESLFGLQLDSVLRVQAICR